MPLVGVGCRRRCGNVAPCSDGPGVAGIHYVLAGDVWQGIDHSRWMRGPLEEILRFVSAGGLRSHRDRLMYRAH